MLGVSRSGYYTWRERSPSRRSHERTPSSPRRSARYTSGAAGKPMVTPAGARRVARLRDRLRTHERRTHESGEAVVMREARLRGCLRGKRSGTTRPDACAVPAPDLVRRKFAAAAPDRLWMADITIHPNRRRVPPPVFRSRRLLPQVGRLVDGFPPPAHRTGGRRPGDGRLEAQTRRRVDPPHRSRVAVQDRPVAHIVSIHRYSLLVAGVAAPAHLPEPGHTRRYPSIQSIHFVIPGNSASQ